MVLILNHDERVALHDLVRDVPGRGSSAGATTDVQPGALPQGVQREAIVLADRCAVRRLDGPLLGAQVGAQEFLKWSFADEADARAVRFVEDRQPRSVSHAANLRLAQVA